MREMLICMILASLAGCAAAPENHYYLLSAKDAKDNRSGTPPRATGLVRATVILPGVSDRSQLVVRTGRHTVEVRELDRWAEPFDRMVQRVLNNDLMSRTMSLHDRPRIMGHDRHITVSIDEFMADASGTAYLSGRWEEGLSPQVTEHGNISSFSLSEPFAGYQSEIVVTTMSDLLDRLAELIVRDATTSVAARSGL